MKSILNFLVIIFLSFFISVPALAAPNIGFENGGMAQKIGTSAGYDTKGGETTLSTTIGKIVRAMLSLSGTLFLALTVYGGVRWMLARGDEAEIEKSKEIIKAALIGMAISMAAYAITTFVVSKITASTVGNQVGGSTGSANPSSDSASESCVGTCYDPASLVSLSSGSDTYIRLPDQDKFCSGGQLCARKSTQ